MRSEKQARSTLRDVSKCCTPQDLLLSNEEMATPIGSKLPNETSIYSAFSFNSLSSLLEVCQKKRGTSVSGSSHVFQDMGGKIITWAFLFSGIPSEGKKWNTVHPKIRRMDAQSSKISLCFSSIPAHQRFDVKFWEPPSVQSRKFAPYSRKIHWK